MPDLDNTGKSREAKGERLSDHERDLMRKITGNPMLWEDAAKTWIADYVAQNSLIPISQVHGFDTYRALYGVRAFDSSDSIDTNMTAVSWEGVTYDDGPFWDDGSPTRLTVPAHAGGVYIASFFASASATSVTAQVQLNNATPNNGIVANGRGSCAAVLSLSGGDFLIALSQIDSGSAGGETPVFTLIRQPGPPGSQ